MRICVVGAGAIGGLMGAKLALAGEDVTLIDVGAHLEAIKKNGQISSRIHKKIKQTKNLRVTIVNTRIA